MSEEQVQEAPELEYFVPLVDTPDDDSLVDSENLNKGIEKLACFDILNSLLIMFRFCLNCNTFFSGESESDDGVSVISDSGPEEEEEVVVARAESVCEEQELLELGEKGEAQYKHQPNPQLNFLLNAILVVAFASVSGLAVGHFLGAKNPFLGGICID